MFKCLVSSVKGLCESLTICAPLVKIQTVVTLFQVGLSDVWSSRLSVCGFLGPVSEKFQNFSGTEETRQPIALLSSCL